MIFYENLETVAKYFNLTRNYNGYKAFDNMYKTKSFTISKKSLLGKKLYIELVTNIGYHLTYKYIIYQYKRYEYITQKQKYMKNKREKKIKCKYLIINKKKTLKTKKYKNITIVKNLNMYIKHRICKLIEIISHESPIYDKLFHNILLIYILTNKYMEIYTMFIKKHLCIYQYDKKNTKVEINPNSSEKCKKCGANMFVTWIQKRRSDEGPTILHKCQNCTENLLLT